MLPIVILLAGCDQTLYQEATVVEVIVENESGGCGSCCCCEDDCCCDDDDDTDVGECEDFEPSFSPGSVSTDLSCEADRPEVTLDANVEWQWPPEGTARGFDQVMMTPVSAPLTDTNSDGIVDGNDTPAVVFTAYEGSAYTSRGILVVLNGDTGVERFRVNDIRDPSNTLIDNIPGVGGVALGDIDNDGSPDICVAGTAFPLHCLEADGSLKWTASDPDTTDTIALEVRVQGYPAIADLNIDGTPEVVLGRQIFDGVTGQLLAGGQQGWSAGIPSSPGRAISTVADMNDDGELDLVAGDAWYAWDTSTTTLVDTPFLLGGRMINDGFPGVADMDFDGMPEVVSVSSGTVSIVEDDGTVSSRWALVEPAANGGPPTIADFDGDNQPEIGVAGIQYYAVYEVDGTLVWQSSAVDISSNITGSSVFDFEGDGRAEVIYADETRLHILDGVTGSQRLMASTTFDPLAHASGTLYEMPVPVDIDDDGSTEIILASNDMFSAGWNGVRAIGSLTNGWMPSRPTWNQHAYHITNIEDSAAVPSPRTENWTVFNNFRVQDQSDAPSDRLADLSLLDPELCADCGADQVTVYVPVVNDGLVDAGPFTLAVEDTNGLVATENVALVSTGTSLLVGPIVFPVSGLSGPLTFRVDSANVVEECDEDNNALTIAAPSCD
ncbi:MAG: FG-GAP-like repeat-containing protein [Myxococcota bacterium]